VSATCLVGQGEEDEPIGDVRLDETEHLLGSLGSLDEYTVVDLEQTEQLEDLARLGCNFVDTATSQPLVTTPRDRTHPLIRITK
jgi:hypothetical protein